MEENKTTYVLYLYNAGILKKFPGASKGNQYYNSEGDAIKGAQQHFKNLKNVFCNEHTKKCVQEMQALIVKYTNSYESRIIGILENCGTTYTKLQGLVKPEDLKTRMVYNKNDTDTFRWHKQSEDDIWFAIDDWGYHRFVCLMKDGKRAEFGGLLDENYDGEIIPHIDCISDNYDYDTDDIEMWREIPITNN